LEKKRLGFVENTYQFCAFTIVYIWIVVHLHIGC